MSASDKSKELERLIKSIETKRRLLKRLWQRVENLNAAIANTKHLRFSVTKHFDKKKSKGYPDCNLVGRNSGDGPQPAA